MKNDPFPELTEAIKERDAYKRKLEDIRYFMTRLANDLDFERQDAFAKKVWDKCDDETAWQI
jgi:hypothetical protein